MPYRCPDCGKEYPRQKELRAHLHRKCQPKWDYSNVLTGNGAYKCPKCGVKFGLDEAAWKAHIKNGCEDYSAMVKRVAKKVAEHNKKMKKAKEDAAKHKAHALAWRECGDMLADYESADPEHDTPVHKEMRERVRKECHRKEMQYSILADDALMKGSQ